MSGVRSELMTKYLPTNFTDLLGAQQSADIKGGNRELVPNWYPATKRARKPRPICSSCWRRSFERAPQHFISLHARNAASFVREHRPDDLPFAVPEFIPHDSKLFFLELELND